MGAWLIRAALGLVAAYLLVCVLAFLFQRRVLFPAQGMKSPPRPAVAGAVSLDIPHADGLSEGILLPRLSGPAPGPAVILGHGNGETFDAYLDSELVAAYRRLGVAVALLEYRGYGRSQGSPSEAGLSADLVAFYDALAARPEIDRIYLHGYSLGGGVVSTLLGRRPIAGVVLESTFTSTRPFFRGLFLPGFLARDPFDTEAALAAFDGPSLIIHGRADQVVPFSHGEALAARAKRGVFLPRDCDHFNCPRDALYFNALRALLSH